DLVNVNNDQIKVELVPPAIGNKTITYHLPKIVPGTYSEDDYGRYVVQLKAFDKKGDTLQVKRAGINSWIISDADKMTKLSYLVNDSYDDTATKQVIFAPAVRDIQDDNIYVIHTYGFLAYSDDMKNIPYELT